MLLVFHFLENIVLKTILNFSFRFLASQTKIKHLFVNVWLPKFFLAKFFGILQEIKDSTMYVTFLLEVLRFPEVFLSQPYLFRFEGF